MKKIIIISGPTASGKSSLALQMAAMQDIAIINADALQIYQGLPILSAQPNVDDKKIVPHFLYSYLSCDQLCSVGLWLKLVKSTVEEIWQQNKLPIIVGGSGMYISKLLDGISEIPEIDEAIKFEARELYKNLTREEFVEKLIANGEEKEKIQNLDKQRLIRAYEVLLQTKKPLSFWQTQPAKQIFPQEIFTHVNLDLERDKLYQNCNERFRIMLKNGAIEEVESLMKKGANDEWQVTKTLGFVEIGDFLSDKISQEKMIEIATQKTRNYAKRQLTWFRNQFIPEKKKVFSDIEGAKEFLKFFKK